MAQPDAHSPMVTGAGRGTVRHHLLGGHSRQQTRGEDGEHECEAERHAAHSAGQACAVRAADAIARHSGAWPRPGEAAERMGNQLRVPARTLFGGGAHTGDRIESRRNTPVGGLAWHRPVHTHATRPREINRAGTHLRYGLQ